MLTITIPSAELWDEERQRFITSEEAVLCLEHSLVSLSKWESITEKPFFGNGEKTTEDVILYVKCMTFPEEADPEVYDRLSKTNFSEINAYIDRKMTATWFREDQKGPRSREVVTSELIYYWMISLGIPKECENWHLNRLFTLIRVCNVKNGPSKKMSKRDIASTQRELNAQRRAQLGTRG